MWPPTADALVEVQRELAGLSPPLWRPSGAHPLVAGCYVCFARAKHQSERADDRGWAAAALTREGQLLDSAVATGVASEPYKPGLLALREGPLLEAAIRALTEPAELLMVHGTSRDHPRGAGLALHLGAVLDIPSVGLTDRPLHATGAEPAGERGATSRLLLNGVEAARMLRTRADACPVVVHAGWRTDLDTAVSVALASTHGVRTPEPLRRARRLARETRAAAGC